MSRLRPWVLGVATIAAGIAALVAINLVDEELTAQTRALYERPARPFSRDSGWALLVGLNAPIGQDPRTYANPSVPGSRQAADARKALQPRLPDELAVRAPAELLCLPQSMDCVAAFRAKPLSIDEMAADNAILLSRYDELLRSSDLADVVHGLDSWDTFFPAAVLLGVQRIRLSQIGAAAARGQLDTALAWLGADAAFHRRWLGEADTMLSKMVAVRTFTFTLLMAGQVARSAPSLSPAQAEALERIAAPLSERERGVGAPIRSEAVIFGEMLDEMIAGPRATSKVTGAPPFMAVLAGRTLRRNATLNFAAPLYSAWMRLDAIDTPVLAPEIERIRAAESAYLAPNWKWAYNPAGRAVAGEGLYDVSEYVYRVRDADALAALIRCAVGLRSGRVPKESAAEFIATDARCRDPYAARAFAWDAARGELSFTASTEKTAERFGGALGSKRVPFAPYPR